MLVYRRSGLVDYGVDMGMAGVSKDVVRTEGGNKRIRWLKISLKITFRAIVDLIVIHGVSQGGGSIGEKQTARGRNDPIPLSG